MPNPRFQPFHRRVSRSDVLKPRLEPGFGNARSESSSSKITPSIPKNQDNNITKQNYISRRSQASVRFSTVEFRYYPIIIGDNPSVSRGIPLTIDWDHWEEATTIVPVEEKEEYLQNIPYPVESKNNNLKVYAVVKSENSIESNQHKQKSASKPEVRVWEPLERVYILKASGHSTEELLQALLQTNNRRNELMETAMSQHIIPKCLHIFVLEPIQEIWDTLRHGMRCCLPKNDTEIPNDEMDDNESKGKNSRAVCFYIAS